MCTAISYTTGAHYFGRNLDLERSYGERVVITPQRFPLPMRLAEPLNHHYAMIGMATVAEGYPLYYEATNEKGLSMAGLNFPDNAVYKPPMSGRDNISPFEFIPWILGRCATVADARQALERVNLAQVPFSENLPLSPLHWLLADRKHAVVVESVAQGLRVYDNPVRVLTNNPPFPYHLTNLCNYMSLHEGAADNRLGGDLTPYSLGMGALGLPGDYSSASRFVRAVFVRQKSRCEGDETASVNQFFHILTAVAMPKGCVLAANGDHEYTRYSCCCNTDSGTYYYTTYDNPTPRRVDMRGVDVDGAVLWQSALIE